MTVLHEFVIGIVCLVVGGILGYAFRGKEVAALKSLLAGVKSKLP